ncbi:hypothetical protein Q8F55_002393 [Vanrija albida]|uniref:Transmembrane protein n=1 Tax=Vanrija albida TaxID=181172 RepID=A0ABR3QA88_9TREE
MAPLLLSHFRPKHRSVLTSLFTVTFLGAVVVVAFPCPAQPSDQFGRRVLADTADHGAAQSATSKEAYSPFSELSLKEKDARHPLGFLKLYLLAHPLHLSHTSTQATPGTYNTSSCSSRPMHVD